MPFTFKTEQRLPFPRDLVFAFFANPENLPRLMPAWQRARIEEATFAPAPLRPAGARHFPGTVAGSGSRLTLSFRPFPFSPVRLAWDALIEDFRWNEGFCDVQERGPFASWRHCHTVQDDGPTATLLRDEVHYDLPLGPLSAVANLLVRPQLAATFRFRQKRTLDLLSMAAS